MAAEGTRLLAEVRAGRKPWLRHKTFSAVAGMAGSLASQLRVVDFGGGPGMGFVHLLATLPPEAKLEYHIVELPGMCDEGRRIFADDAHIKFHTALADAPASPDVVYVNCVLQYFENYQGQLRALALLGAPWLLLARAATGDIPTFATRQLNLTGQILPYWFVNRAEFVELLGGQGYRLVWESACEHEDDQSNFPETHRIGRMRNLLFAHSSLTFVPATPPISVSHACY